MEEMKSCQCGESPVIYGNGNARNYDHIQVMCPFPKGCGRNTGWIKTTKKEVAIKAWNTRAKQGEL